MVRKCKRVLAMFLAVSMIVGYAPMAQVDVQAAQKKTKVKKVKLNKTQYVLKKGQKVKLKATVTPKAAKKTKVTWKSSKPKVATVNSKGVVKAKAKKGKTVITAKAGNKKAKCTITVGTPVKKITASNMKLTVGQSKNLVATVKPAKATIKKLEYKSLNTSVATVNKSGLVTAKKAGTAKIKITAKDCGKVTKQVTVTVENKKTTTKPSTTTKPDADGTDKNNTDKDNTNKDETDTKPTFSMSFTETVTALAIGETWQPQLTFTPDTIANKAVTWTSSDDNVLALNDKDGTFIALTPGTCDITATSVEDSRVSVSCTVKVGSETDVVKTVTSQEELDAQLTANEANIIVLETEATEITITEGNYDNVVLVVKAPNAHIENVATFQHVLIQSIAEDTWVERSGNHIYMNSTVGHMMIEDNANPKLNILSGTDSITVTNNGNLQEMLIASAAKVLVKGDSVATKIPCNVVAGGKLTTYIPLDIYSTTKYNLVVGPGGEQTALHASDENSIPEVSGIGTLSITVDSTGKHSTIIAENDGSIELPTATLQGMVVNELSEAVSAKVYLVSYSKQVTGDNIDVYLNGSKTKETDTDETGTYTFADVEVGNYIVVVEADGFQLVTENIYIPASYEGMTYVADNIMLMESDGESGNIQGTLSDAQTGDAISKSLTVILRKGMNNITSNAYMTTYTQEDGSYTFENVEPGQYTIQVRDENETIEYVSVYFNVSVLSGATITKNYTISKSLNAEEVRFVLTWDGQEEGVSEDLDIFLYSPKPMYGNEMEIYFGEWNTSDIAYDMGYKYVNKTTASLDVDDKQYEGPETITVKNMQDGQYKIFVKDFTNGGAGNMLASSNPVVKVYVGNTLKETFKMPEKEGGVWFACVYDGATGEVKPVNEVSNVAPNESVRAQIGTLLNQFQQFIVTDAQAAATNQATITQVKANYLKETDETKLQEYLTSLETIYESYINMFTMDKITLDGVAQENFYSFHKSHYLYGFYGSTPTIGTVDVVMEEEDSEVTYVVEKYSQYEDDDPYADLVESNDYRITLTSSSLGVCTYYYFDYYQEDEPYWVTNISDSENRNFEYNGWESYGYAGGYNAQFGKTPVITYGENIICESISYREEIDETEWTYGDTVDVVLHLKNTETQATKDFQIHYIPLGAELENVIDPNNVYTYKDDGYYAWYWENDITTYYLYGVNETFGNTCEPIVTQGAEYTIEYPEDIESTENTEEDGYYEEIDWNARVTVTRDNGAKRVYHLYYYQDTSDAELLGVYDSTNIYTEYHTYDNNVYGGRVYYNIELHGLNSTLGENLTFTTKPGATATVEYATDSESWDISSDAKVTITAESGVQRIYYIVYEKSAQTHNIRGISSENVYKAYLSGSYLYVYGKGSSFDENATFTTNVGYTAEYDEYSNQIIVTETATKTEQYYYIAYTQINSGTQLKAISSPTDVKLECRIGSYLNDEYFGETQVSFYTVDLTGDAATCPTDLKAWVSAGATATITYAENAEEWMYDSGSVYYEAEIIISNEAGDSAIYLVNYTQDDSGTIVESIKDAENNYAYSFINSYTRRIRLKEANESGSYYTDVYRVDIIGENATLGDTYELTLPQDSTVLEEQTVKCTDEAWLYAEQSFEVGYYAKQNQYITCDVAPVEQIVVQASNGATRTYVICYGQDESGAIISAITDTENQYKYAAQIDTDVTDMGTEETTEDGETTYGTEEVYKIKVVGDNATLGTTYELDIPEGAEIVSTTYVADESWNYTTEWWHDDIYDEESEKYVYMKFVPSARIVVQASNGAQRIYVIAYAQDESGAIVSGITDETNAFKYEPKISTSTYIYTREETLEDGSTSRTTEDVYRISVVGDNATVGMSYQLHIPEGAKIVSTTYVTDDAWDYTNVSYSNYLYDEENNKSIYLTFYNAARIVIEAENGVQRVYVIGYVQDDSEAVVTGVTDETNTYTYTPNIDTNTTVVYRYKETEDGTITSFSEGVQRINIIGDNATLGTSYQLTLPEGTKAVSTTYETDEEWDYMDEVYSDYVYDKVTGGGSYIVFHYAARIVVEASNGAQRIYVIGYKQDDSGAVISGITDESNLYIYTPQIATYTDIMYRTEETEDGSVSSVAEEVYKINIMGDNATLGTSYQLTIPEGAEIVSTTYVTDENWAYSATTDSQYIYDEETETRTYVTFYYAARIVIEASNGAQRIYVIGYVQDDRETVISEVTDESNTYILEPYISSSVDNCIMRKSDCVYEEVYAIKILGDNATLGETFQLQIPEGSTATITYSTDEAWDYEASVWEDTIYDEATDSYVDIPYTCTARVLVTASNGAERIYVIAYAQDDRDAIVSAITDDSNTYIYTPEINTTEYSLHTTDEDGTTDYETVYRISVVGTATELGTSYQLTMPEGTELVSTTYATDEAWNYSSTTYSKYMYDEDGNGTRFTFTYVARVVVRASNGAEKIYVIGYAQDESTTS